METQRIGCFSVQVEPRSPVQQSSKRNWHAKVRTGCSTCKKRRVKCDETRPHCMRCVKLGSPCGGYVQGPESSSDKNGITTRNRILLPNTYSTCLRPNPGTTCFRSEQEKAYFGSWFTKSQGFCEDSLFSIFFVAVSQLALDQNEVLRDIVLALGALTLAPGQQVHTLTPNQQQNIRSGPHYQTALSCYGRALRAMSAMAVSEATVGTILRCCILLICFDLVDGRHQSVHVHIQHGLRILRQYLLSKAGRVDFDLCANAPAPCIVDESMIHLFQRCSSISYVQLGARYSLQHCEMAPSRREGAERSKLLESMLPRKFYTIDEAARWLDLLQNALRSLFLESEASNHGLDDESNRIWEAERSRHVRVLECWAAAFLALERKQVNIGEDEDIAQGEGDRVGLQMMRRIAALKMQYHNAYIFSYTSHYHDYESLVEMEPRFRDIVDLAGTLIGDQSVPEVHTVVPLTISGAILPLFVTANKCRDAGVRRSAEELLRQLSNRVEGLWDSRAALALTSWARKAEEAYALQLSDPKEIWNKVRSRYILFSDRQNQAKVGFQWWREGSWVYLEEVVEW